MRTQNTSTIDVYFLVFNTESHRYFDGLVGQGGSPEPNFCLMLGSRRYLASCNHFAENQETFLNINDMGVARGGKKRAKP